MTEVRPIGPDFDGWDALLSLILSAFAFMDGLIDPPSSAHRLTPDALAKKAREEIGLLAVEGEMLVGCMFLKPEEESLYIGKLAVLPSFQGRGAGRSLLEHAEALARKKGLATLRLETRVELAANHALFTRWGFVRTAEKSHPGFARPTSIEMCKTLV
ncbi:GNAT family N-acetyltransferase [Shinella sp.]|uniref:GNAT family N-acetyltransferase n=1 Tax=Shinella sp. TaxID=1870904 RepID=UPI003D2CFEB5